LKATLITLSFILTDDFQIKNLKFVTGHAQYGVPDEEAEELNASPCRMNVNPGRYLAYISILALFWFSVGCCFTE